MASRSVASASASAKGGSGMDIKQLKESPITTPYTKSLKIKIMKMGEWTSYNQASGKAAKFLKFIAADPSGHCNAMAYDYDGQVQQLKANKSILLRGYTFSQQKLKLMAQTKIYRCEPVAIPDHIEDAIDESTNKITLAANVQTSPIKAIVSLQGTITKEEAIKDVIIGNRAAKVKELTIQDDSGEVKLALWDGMATSPVKCGESVRLEGTVRYSSFHGENTVALNTFSSISPMEKKESVVSGQILAVSMSGSKFQVVVSIGDTMATEQEFSCSISTFAEYLNISVDETSPDVIEDDLIMPLLPIICQLKIQGNDIIKIE